MKSDAQASSAALIRRQARGLDPVTRLIVASRALNRRSDGTGASWHRSSLLAFVLLAALFALAPRADAANFQRPLKETFGSAAQPSFGWSSTIAVDRKTGDVLIADAQTGGGGEFLGTISRFHANGTPAPFEALGTNTIDGSEANGRPCVEEPASCDKTPESQIEISTSSATAIAIDESGGPAEGDIYVTQVASRLIDIFAANGRYLGQVTGADDAEFKEIGGPCGVSVDAAGAVYVATNQINGELHKYVPKTNPIVNGDDVADYAPLTGGRGVCNIAVGVGPTSGDIFGVSNREGTGVAYEFDKATGALKYTFGQKNEPDPVGTNSVAVDPNTGTTLISGGSASGAETPEIKEFEAPDGARPVKVGRILLREYRAGFAVSASSEVIAGEGPRSPNVFVFGTPGLVPTVTSDPANNVSGTKASLAGTVNPTGLEVTKCFFEYGETGEYGKTVPCAGPIPTDSDFHPVRADIADLEPDGHEYHFRLVAENENGREESQDRTLTTAYTVVTEAAAPVGIAGATLNGTVRPEGDPYSECFFEYGLSSSTKFERTAPCEPGPTAIGSDYSPHAVKARIAGLQTGTTYRYRLVATDGLGTLRGEDLTFDTSGKPRIAEIQAGGADQGAVTIEATVNPSGFGTSYHFEWGSTAEYGSDVPAEFEPFVGSGTEPVLVKAKISGLAAGTVYHYRVVATNSQGTTQSADHEMETVNSCGLPDGRCFELASPRDAGPIGIPGKPNYNLELRGQAGAQPGAIAYVVESGLPGASRGAEVLYRGVRTPDGWSASQISPPILARDENLNVQSESSRTLALSPDISCGVTESTQPLTADASTRALMEAGGKNLYRSNPDGSFTAISRLTPVNFDAENFEPESESGLFYELAGMSRNCSSVVFTSVYRFPGIGGEGKERLYEWNEGTLRNVGVVPGPSGPTVVEAFPGGRTPGGRDSTGNSVSEDGARVFFSAQRLTSEDPAEIGMTAVFVREDGSLTRDVSMSETATPDEGAHFQYATSDGSRVFFTANAGLTARSSSEGTDLYEYNLDAEKLTDLSVLVEPGGAEVGGMLGASDDGSHVYFAALGQLVSGKGKTRAGNLQAGTYSVYSESESGLSFVAPLSLSRYGTSFLGDGGAFVDDFGKWTARVSPDGRYLLFESSAETTGYGNEGSLEAYLFDADAGSGATVCISCRRDGEPPASTKFAGNPLLASPSTVNLRNPFAVPLTLVIKGGKPEVLFTSADPLAPGIEEGNFSVYEWSHGQVFRVATEPPGLQMPNSNESEVDYLGASVDGSDLYLQTAETLTWEDGDQRSSLYDARVGGGSPQPAPPSPPCNPIVEGSCSSDGSSTAALPGAASATFSGPGNEKPNRHKKKHRKRSHKKKHKKSGRTASPNRRAAK